MEENTKEVKEAVINIQDNVLINLPELNDEIKKQINLAINHDGLESSTIYFNNFIERFGKYFNKIFLICEQEIPLENLIKVDNLSIISSLKPSEFSSEWIMILETGEFPSIQLLENFESIITNINQKTFIVKFPIVVCDSRDGEIIEVLPPLSRLFKKNPQLLHNQSDEITMNDYPIIRLSIDFQQIDS